MSESAKVSVTVGVGWAILIEPDKDPRKVLRVTLPLGMQLAHGTRIAIDQKQPATGSYAAMAASPTTMPAPK